MARMLRTAVAVVVGATTVGVTASASVAAGADPDFVARFATTPHEYEALSTVADDGTIVVATATFTENQVAVRRVSADGQTIATANLTVPGAPGSAHFVEGVVADPIEGWVWVAIKALSRDPVTRLLSWKNAVVRLRDNLTVERTVALPGVDQSGNGFQTTGLLLDRSSGRLYVSGAGQGVFRQETTDGVDPVVLAYDSPYTGLSWANILDDPGFDTSLTGLAAGTSGGVALGWDSGEYHYVSQLSRDGSEEWTTRVGAVDNDAVLLAVAGDGQSRVYAGGEGGMLTALDSNGGVVRTTQLVHFPTIRAVATRGSDHVIVAGSKDVAVAAESGAFTSELDAAGEVVWSDVINDGGQASVDDVTSADRVYVSGILAGVGAAANGFVAAYPSTVRPSAPALYPYEGDGFASFEWDPPADDGGVRTGYVLRIEPGGYNFVLPASAVFKRVDGLTNGVTYTASFAAVNSAGEGDPHVVTFTPWGAPTVPTSLQASVTADGISVQWNASNPNGRPVTGYDIQIDGAAPVNVGNVTSRIVTGLGPGVHRFRVRAVSDWRTSAYSPEAQVNTALPIELAIDARDLSVSEGDRLATVHVRVELTRATTVPVTVAWRTRPGTAKGGSDFVSKSGTVTIPAGSTAALVPAKIKGDRRIEADERFTLELSKSVGAPIAGDVAVVTLRNDD